MVDVIEERDTYTAGHSKRVATYSKMIAEAFGLEFMRVNEETVKKLQEILQPVVPIKREEAQDNSFSFKKTRSFRRKSKRQCE